MGEEVNSNDPQAREIREKAVDYAERVQAGDEPWKDVVEEDAGGDVDFSAEEAPKDDYVGEDGPSDAPDAVEVNEVEEDDGA